jgi:hypothetical protein
MIISWPKEIVTEIARRRSVIFLGSGISRQSRNANGDSPPTWRQLLTGGTAKLPGPAKRRVEIRRLISNGDFLSACEAIKSQLGETQFYSFLTAQLLSPNFQPAAIHDSIVKLNSRIYATPNFDKIFDAKMSSLTNSACLVKNYYDDDVAVIARSLLPTVIKIHGTIDTPRNMVFTRSDYAKARTKYATFYAILEALAITHTFLFLGCGLSDPDIRLLLEDHAFSFSGMPPHYFVAQNGEIPAALIPSMEANLNIRVILYKGGHDQLKPAIDELVEEVNKERSQMQLERTW